MIIRFICVIKNSRLHLFIHNSVHFKLNIDVTVFNLVRPLYCSYSNKQHFCFDFFYFIILRLRIEDRIIIEAELNYVM